MDRIERTGRPRSGSEGVLNRSSFYGDLVPSCWHFNEFAVWKLLRKASGGGDVDGLVLHSVKPGHRYPHLVEREVPCTDDRHRLIGPSISALA